jgi:hypothetical protein
VRYPTEDHPATPPTEASPGRRCENDTLEFLHERFGDQSDMVDQTSLSWAKEMG